MTDDFCAYNVPDQGTAISIHRRLRADGTSILRRGQFYMAMLERGLWSSQAAMAADLKVSASNVSRSMTAARLPKALVDAAGGDGRITFSVADSLDFLSTHLGSAIVAERVRELPLGLSIKEIEHALLTGAPPRAGEVTVSISANRTHLIVESDELSSVLRRAPDIAHLITAILRAK
ncbi:hypothetical protein [Burkholderia cepacia]|uniref:hypothetical protein n=2 Tax=Burkholderia cepacia complex TaxID=87882 RepID=UPI002AB7BB8A|nr:hypothetical protein [Burkholderia cepacia]